MYYVLKKEAADRIRRAFKDDADVLIMFATIQANYFNRHVVSIEMDDDDFSMSLTLTISKDFESVKENPLEGLTVKVADVSNLVWWKYVIKHIAENGFFFFMGSVFLLVAFFLLDISSRF